MKLSWTQFWLGAACMFVVVFFIDYKRYVMPDALSTAVGAVGGTMVGVWVLWRLIKFCLPKITPDARFFVLVVSCLLLGLELLKQ